MAEFLNTRYICAQMREYVKKESRRIRLLGVRAKTAVFIFDDTKPLTFLKTFSWADISTAVCRARPESSALEYMNDIARLSGDPKVHGVIIVPPKHTNIQTLFDSIPVEKDVSCRSASAISAMLCREKRAYLPCLAEGVMRILRYYNVDYSAKHVLLLGIHNDMRLLGQALINAGSIVTQTTGLAGDIERIASESDIIISMTNTASSMGKGFFRENQVVIDLGLGKNSEGRAGDACFDEAEKFVEGIFLREDGGFTELTDYILTEHVLKSAAAVLKKK